MESDVIKVLRHTGIYLLARGLPGIIAFLAIPLFTRVLDPDAYGKYALIVATASLINAVLYQWLRLSLLRYLPAYRENPAKLKSTVLTMAGVIAVGSAFCAGAMSLLPIAASWHAVIWPCWLLLTTQSAFEIFCEHTRAIIRPWQYMGMQFARVTIWVSLGAAIAFFGGTWRGPLAGMVVGMAIPSVWAWFRQWRDARVSIDRKVLAAVAVYGLPLSATVALAVVIASSDRFLIASLLNEGAAGIYSVAADLASQSLTLLMMVVYLATFPLAVRAWEQEGPPAARQRMRHNAAMMLVVGVPTTIGLAILAPNIAQCVLGKSFRAPATAIMPLLAIGALLAGLKAFHFDLAFQFAQQTIHQVWIVLVAAVVNVVLNLVAIPRLGIQGAALASAIAYVVSIALTAWYGRRHFAVPFPIRALAEVSLAGGAMALVIWPLRGQRGVVMLAAQIACGAAVYGATLAALNFLGIRELAMGAIASRRGRNDSDDGADGASVDVPALTIVQTPPAL
jgi:O-antigen/teichoic acid export membrane protein